MSQWEEVDGSKRLGGGSSARVKRERGRKVKLWRGSQERMEAVTGGPKDNRKTLATTDTK